MTGTSLSKNQRRSAEFGFMVKVATSCDPGPKVAPDAMAEPSVSAASRTMPRGPRRLPMLLAFRIVITASSGEIIVPASRGTLSAVMGCAAHFGGFGLVLPFLPCAAGIIVHWERNRHDQEHEMDRRHFLMGSAAALGAAS